MSATVTKATKAGKSGNFKPKRVFTVNCSVPVKDEIFDVAAFNDYLTSRIKVVKGGKTGQVGGQVTVNNDGNIVTVATRTQFAKRYIKYLTKKFLKKNQLRDYVRVTASRSGSYQLSYFSMQKQGEEASE